MRIYFDIITFNFLRYLAYPYELIGSVGDNVVELLLILLFWFVVSKSSHNTIRLGDIMSYLLIASAVSTFVMAESLQFGSRLKNSILMGEMSNYMIRPINLLRFMYTDYLGQIGISLLISLALFFVGLALHPLPSVESIVLFGVFLFLALILSLSFNIFIGVIAFYTGEVTNIKNVIIHVISILSGVTIPITFFPSELRNIVLFTPFPYMVFMPVHVLQAKEVSPELLMNIIPAILWAGILWFLSSFLWKQGIKKYEAVGI